MQVEEPDPALTMFSQRLFFHNIAAQACMLGSPVTLPIADGEAVVGGSLGSSGSSALAHRAAATAATTGGLAGRIGPTENPPLVRRDGVEEDHIRGV